MKVSASAEDPDRFVSLVLAGQIRVSKALLKTLVSRSNGGYSVLLANAAAKSIVQGLECLENVGTEEPEAAAANVDGFITPSPPRRKRRRQESDQPASQETTRSSRRKQILLGLRGCVLMVNVGLSNNKRVFKSDLFFPAVQSLHDRLVTLEDDPELQDSICELCELWWKEGFHGRESLIAQSLPFLMSRSLTSNRKVDVHRVHSMREAFSLFDYMDESIEDMKHLLIRSVVTPSFLRSAEGRRFISFLFGLSPQLVKELNAVMHSQIPFGRKSIIEAYGEILYRAWKSETQVLQKEEIESSCVQSLMEGAIYACNKTSSSACRKVLEGFLSQRAECGVEAMLFRLQEPLLFRSLQVANANVRRNAVLLLIDMFPLQQPDACKEEKEMLLERQFTLIEKLLYDPCPDVRSITVEGTCRILRLFWEVVPPTITAKLLTKIVEDLSKDQNSNSARLAVLHGITYLLENSESHEILKVLLPRLSHMLNDPAVTVRASAVELLLVVKDIRGIPFHKVASLDTLLSVLENDYDAVASLITRLLLPSYFPMKTPVIEACNRCCTLIKRSPLAGARFCSLVFSEGGHAESLFELLKFLCRLVVPESTDLDEEHREGVLLAISELGSSMASSGERKMTVGDYFTGKVLINLLKAACTPRARTSVLKLASYLPPKDVPELTNYARNAVKNQISSEEIRAIDSFLLSWGGFEDLAHALLDSLSRFSQSEKHRTSKRKSNTKISTRSKVIKPGAAYSTAVGAAWHVQNLLAENETKKALLSSGSFQGILSALKSLAEYSMKQVDKVTVHLMLSSVVTAYANLAIHLSLERKRDGNVRTSTGRRKRHRVDVSTTTPASNPSDGVEGALKELIDWAIEMLENISSYENHQGTFVNGVKLATATLHSVMEALNLGLTSDDTLQSRALYLASAFAKKLQRVIESHDDQHEELMACFKASASYAGKLLSICTSSHDAEACSLANIFLDILAVIEKQGSGFQLLPALRSWMPDLITAATEKREKECLRTWILHVATEGSPEYAMESEESPQRSCEQGLTQAILKVVPKLSKQASEAFIDLLVQYATLWFDSDDYMKGCGALNLICEKILLSTKMGLEKGTLAGLRRIDNKLSERDEQELQSVKRTLKQILSPYESDT